MFMVSRVASLAEAARRSLAFSLFLLALAQPVMADDIELTGLDAQRVIREGRIIYTASEVDRQFVYIHHLIELESLLFLCFVAGDSGRFRANCVHRGN